MQGYAGICRAICRAMQGYAELDRAYKIHSVFTKNFSVFAESVSVFAESVSVFAENV
jgi:hypothetical protein